MTITIYHNPACGTSRNTLAMIRQSGEEPQVIEYLKTPPTREKLIELIAAMAITPRELLREKGTPYAEFGLGDPKWADDEIVDFLATHGNLADLVDHQFDPMLQQANFHPASVQFRLHRPPEIFALRIYLGTQIGEHGLHLRR